MALLLAWVAFPLVLLALCGGLGLLVDALCGRRLPGALVAPVGLAAAVVVGSFTTSSDATAELTMPLVVLLAILGLAFSLPWRFDRPEPWLLAAALGVFLVFGAPVILSGEPTFAGYIKLDDTATWFAITDRVMDHGHSLDGLGPSTYRATLDFNLASGYPAGTFIPFGTAGKLLGVDLAWIFQPYVAFLAAMLSLALWEILGPLLKASRLRALAVFVAAQPALLFGYSLWGGVKEVGAAAGLALAAALAPATMRADASWRDAAPLALACGAIAGALSVGGLVWVAPMLLILAALAVRRFGVRRAAAIAVPFVILLCLFAAPVAVDGLLPPSAEPLTDPNSLGNLIRPLSSFQLLGIWPSGDFRLHPDATVATAVLVTLGLAAAAFGAWIAWRRRSLAMLLYLTVLVGCAAIAVLGSPWNAGKALATASPVVLALAIGGAAGILRIDRVVGAGLLVVLAAGVLWSNVLAYGGASLAPYSQLRELQEIGDEFPGQGPALMTEYNPYGARHFLREMDGESASELRERLIPLRTGGSAEKGESVDVDELDLNGLLEFRTLVLRRSPTRSRPPSPYRLVWSGKYYEVWQRPAGYAGPAPEHLSLGSPDRPAAVPDCSAVAGLGQLALLHQKKGVRLIAARHAPAYDASNGSLRVPRAGLYSAWLGGSVRGDVELLVDGRPVGGARHQLENEGGFIPLGEVRLGEGTHRVQLRLGGADLHPGSGGFPRPQVGPLLFAPTAREAGALVSVPIEQVRRLCGKPWDWIEAVGSF